MEKFKILAAGNGRSVNKEIEMLMRRAVQEYEREHGPIAVPAPAETE
ncbi:MAG: TraY domain-containing protein [Oscillospiraceae bacterium]|nr:TraY domain-containing protein [Oscillospiraceae bacterium]